MQREQKVRKSVMGIGLVMLLGVLLVSQVAWAQEATSGIAGLVIDTSSAVLPGVTVEASSPVLIEGVRVVFTDGEGRYNIVNLRPGTYTVTFSLPGFSTTIREGVELPSGFTATIDANMRVGGIEETVTVTGASPLVDVQNTRQQSVVTNELLDILPTSGKAVYNLVALTPGLVANADVGGSRGVYGSGGVQGSTFRGKSDTNKLTFDGMRTHNLQCKGGCVGYIPNPAVIEEITLETGGVSAESLAAGLAVNLIPKQGGNSFSGETSGVFSNENMQSSNLDDELRGRGLSTEQKIVKIFDGTFTLGGPIKQDKLWFFTAQRVWGNRNQVPGVFYNLTQGTPFYTPDLSRPYIRSETAQAHAVRLTLQATDKQKWNFFADIQKNRTRGASAQFRSPEAVSSRWDFWPQGLYQVSWTSPRTNRLLIEAAVSVMISHYPYVREKNMTENDVAIRERSNGFWWNSVASIGGGGGNMGQNHNSDRIAHRFSVSYVTGSHNFKVGTTMDQGFRQTDTEVNRDRWWEFRNGVPEAVFLAATPYDVKLRVKADLGVYAQDQWNVNNSLTLNYGLRFDYINAFVPAETLAAGAFVPERVFPRVNGVPNWTDVSPRLGIVYDLFGDSRTAFKAALGRYVGSAGAETALENAPVNTTFSSTSRSWNDANGNFVEDCDLTNFAANGECGAIANSLFGQLDPNANAWDPHLLEGFAKRDYNWDFSLELDHQFGDGIAVTAGYYRSWFGNFQVTQNTAVDTEGYDPYSIIAPIDPRLPGGGGYEVSGLYDVRPDNFGQVVNLRQLSSNFGEHTRVNDFFGVSIDTRLDSGVLFGGGVDFGRSVQDSCFVVNSPQDLLTAFDWPRGNSRGACRTVEPIEGNIQLKMHGSVPLPGDFAVSAVYQNVAGPVIEARYRAGNDLIEPSLGRPLSGGSRSALVPLIEPGTMYEERRAQLDMRLSKIFELPSEMRLRASFDLYNALNDNSVLGIVTTYGGSWLRPSSILPARLIQLSGRLSF